MPNTDYTQARHLIFSTYTMPHDKLGLAYFKQLLACEAFAQISLLLQCTDSVFRRGKLAWSAAHQQQDQMIAASTGMWACQGLLAQHAKWHWHLAVTVTADSQLIIV